MVVGFAVMVTVGAATAPLTQPAARLFGVPASKRALAGSEYVVPLDGSTHGHVQEPKNAGLLLR